MRREWFVSILVIAVLFVAGALLVLPALAQDGETPPGFGEKVDGALLLAGPVFALIAFAAGQILKYVFPESELSTASIMRIVYILAGVVLVIGYGLGYDAQINTGIEWLNSIAEQAQALLITAIQLLTMIFGSKGLYESLKAKRIPVLGAKQGDHWASYARDQDWRRAA